MKKRIIRYKVIDKQGNVKNITNKIDAFRYGYNSSANTYPTNVYKEVIKKDKKGKLYSSNTKFIKSFERKKV